MTLQTDYLVVGAGAAGMAFTDTLIARSDADVILVDRRHRPGGHWNDDYPFVRLHQPSAFYGVDSTPLGSDRIDEAGPNAGLYERATGAEVCAYYARVLEERFLPTGRVRFLPMADYMGEASGEHTITSLLTGDTTRVRARTLVDATYIATTIPSMHKPAYSVDPGVRLMPPNGLTHLAEPTPFFTVIGAGKTSMDTCCWLIDQGVDPGSIRWVRPRDPYTNDREMLQPLTMIAGMAEWLALQYEAAAAAADLPDFLRRLEESGVFRRLDPDVEPQVFRGATLSAQERETLARITDVVRLGRVIHIGMGAMELEEGTVPARAGEVYVDCSASGLGHPPTKPIFEPGRITLQRVQSGIDPFSAALLGVVEASDRSLEEKNRLCVPLTFSGGTDDFALDLLITLRNRAMWMAEPDLRDWQGTTRLSPFRGSAPYLTDEVRASLIRMVASVAPAIENLERIVGEAAAS